MTPTSPITATGYHSGRTAPNKGGTFPPEVLTEDEVKSLIRSCSNRAPTGIRNRALIVVMYRAGLRLSEALAQLGQDPAKPAGAQQI
jgi:site-specific recombinase XerD